MDKKYSKPGFWVTSLLLSCAGLLLSGCQSARMALPQDLQTNSKKLSVEGRSLSVFNRSFEFAPYKVIEVDRGWTKGSGFSIFAGKTEVAAEQAREKYEFSIKEAGQAGWKVQCATGANWNRLDTEGFLGGGFSVERTSKKQLACTLNHDASANPSKLVMGLASSTNDMSLKGVMINDAAQIDISATHKFESSPLQVSSPTGYLFHIDGRPVGAVEVINKGTVWLSKSEKPEIHSVLAAASAVLLLYQDVQETLQGK